MRARALGVAVAVVLCAATARAEAEPDWVLFSEVMTELSKQPEFVEALLERLGRDPAAGGILGPENIKKFRELVLGREFEALDRFPAMTVEGMGRAVRLAARAAKQQAQAAPADEGAAAPAEDPPPEPAEAPATDIEEPLGIPTHGAAPAPGTWMREVGFGLDAGAAEPVRATMLLAAGWYLVFALPLFFLTPDRAASEIPLGRAVVSGLRVLAGTLRELPKYGNIARFLLARMLYTDGLNTLFVLGGIYAAGTFGMDTEEILIFAILLNVTAGLGAASFGWIDDWIGAKRTIQIAVAALALFGGLILLVQSKLWFYLLGAVIGVFIGPAQSASRSMMARLAPAELRTEMFGLYALSGKATAFIGPALVGWVTLWSGSQRLGMVTIMVFFAAGWLLLLPVREPR